MVIQDSCTRSTNPTVLAGPGQTWSFKSTRQHAYTHIGLGTRNPGVRGGTHHLGTDGTARMSVQNCTRPMHSCLGLWVVAGSDCDVRQLRNPVRTQSRDIENFRVRGKFLHFGDEGTAGISVKS